MLTGEGCRVISHEEVKTRLENGDIRLLDVRLKEERKTPGRLPGDCHVPRKLN